MWTLAPSEEYGYDWCLKRELPLSQWEYCQFAGANAKQLAITLAAATGGYVEKGIGE